MSKNVDWSQTYKSPMGKMATESYQDKVQKSVRFLHEQQKAEELLQKAMPVMKSLLMVRMTNKSPITVMRLLPYTTEELVQKKKWKGTPHEEIVGASYQTVQKALSPGTKLVFDRLDKSMNQLVFKTDRDEEVGIYLEEQQKLLTQTDIYEVVSGYINEGEMTNE